MISSLPVVGVLRFSFFGTSDLVQRHDYEAALAEIYNKERMNARFFLFENICLPSIRAQSDPDFSLIILSSDQMPKVYKNRLVKLCKPISQIEVIFAKETGHVDEAVNPRLAEYCEASKAGLITTFRIDDDDAVSCRYIERLKARVLPEESSILTFPKTLAVFRDFDGNLGVTQNLMYCTGIGLARVISKEAIRSPYAMNHQNVWRHNPTISDPTFVCNLRSYHFHNDTTRNRDKNVRKMIENRGDQYGSLHDMQHIDASLKKEFPWCDFRHLSHVFDAKMTKEQLSLVGES